MSAFARDLATDGPLISDFTGITVYSQVFDELRKLILSGKLTRKQLAELAKKLETVDHDFPGLAPSLASEALGAEVTMLQMSDGGPSVREWWLVAKEEGGWRFALSSRRMVLDAFEAKEAYLQRAQNLDQMGYAAARKETDAISAEVRASSNAMVRQSILDLSRVVVNQREPLARLRLLRAGTSFLATGELPALADPFGTELLYSQETKKLRIWSVGTDGKNQNGLGGWSRTPAQQDIVLEIPR